MIMTDHLQAQIEMDDLSQRTHSLSHVILGIFRQQAQCNILQGKLKLLRGVTFDESDLKQSSKTENTLAITNELLRVFCIRPIVNL